MTNNSTPLVSIGLPTYNRYSQLKVCLLNVLSQDYSNLEILVSDNTIELETPEWLTYMISKDHRIKYNKHLTNIGMINNHTYVIENAKGEYFMWMHDDDIFPFNYISKMLDKLLSDKECALAGPVCERFFEGKFWHEYERYNNNSQTKIERLIDISKRAFDNPWSFEHLIYGVFKRDYYPTNFVLGKWRSIIIFFYLISLHGSIQTVDDVKIVKNTTSEDFKKFAAANYVKRYWILKKIFNRRQENRITVLFRLIKFTILSNDLQNIEKIKLILNSIYHHILNKTEFSYPKP